MKSKSLSLTKVFLKNSFNITGKNNKKTVGNFIMIALAFLYLSGIIAFFSFTQISALKMLNQEQLFLPIILIGIVLVVFIQSILSSVNVLYFAKDMESVLQLPVTPKQIIISKMNVIIFTEYIIELIMGLAPMLIYGILTGATFSYYLYTAIVFICLPIFPIAISSILTMIIMSFAKITRNKDKLQMFVTLILVAVILLFQFSIKSGSGTSNDEEITNKIIQSSTGITNVAQKAIIIMPAVNALTSQDFEMGILSIIKLALITVALYIIVIEIGSRIYLRGAIEGTNGSVARISNKKLNYKQKSKAISYIKKEFKILLKNSTFFMQCILPTVLLPIIIIGLVIMQASNGDFGDINLNELISNPIAIICIIICANLFSCFVSMLGVTCISRDGKNANFIKYIPVPLYKQFLYKLAPACIMNIVTFTIIAIPYVIIAKGQMIWALIPAFIITMLEEGIVNYYSEIVDLKHLKLDWNTEYEVVKQNLNTVYPMALVATILVANIILSAILVNVNIVLFILILIALYGSLLIIIDRYVHKNQEKLFKDVI